MGSGPPLNPGSTPGANGGGIIFIQAQEIINNGPGIFADGDEVKNSPAWGDGAGGGGGGGNVILITQAIINTLIVSVKGSNGGNSIDDTGRNMGTGGGGGGGALWYSGAFLPLSVIPQINGGIAGTTSVCNCKHGAVDGSNGVVLYNYVKPQNTTEFDFSSCVLSSTIKKPQINNSSPKNTVVFPIPFDNLITIYTELDWLKISLINSEGQEIEVPCTANHHSITLETNDIKKGIYFIKLVTQNEVITKKLIK
jgi:hypothetical protein